MYAGSHVEQCQRRIISIPDVSHDCAYVPQLTGRGCRAKMASVRLQMYEMGPGRKGVLGRAVLMTCSVWL